MIIRFIYNMHKKKVLVAVILGFELMWRLSFLASYADNTSIDQNFRHFWDGETMSCAWNNSYLFIAKGFSFVGDQVWFDSFSDIIRHYNVSKTNLITHEITTVDGDWNYPGAFLFNENDNVYIVSCPEERVYQTHMEKCLKIRKITINSNETKDYSFDFDDIVNDVVIYKGYVYMISSNSVIRRSIENEHKQVIYHANDTIMNVIDENHATIASDRIYIQDGNMIVSVSIDGNDSYPVVEFPNDYYSYRISNAIYHYNIIDDTVYYWHETSRTMIAANIVTGKSTTISRDYYKFLQITSNGVVAARITKECFDQYENPFVEFEGDLIDRGLYYIVYIPFSWQGQSRYLFPDDSKQILLPSASVIIEQNNTVLDCNRINWSYPCGEWYKYVNLPDITFDIQ